MKSRLAAKLLVLALFAACWLLLPSEARADGINIEAVAVAGVIVLVPLIAFEVFIEAIFFAVGLKVAYRRVLLLALGANLASLAAGIPVKIFNAWMYSQLLPRELAPYFRWYTPVVLLGTAIYFLVTLAIELILVLGWRRSHNVSVGIGRVVLAVVAANAATYSVLAPLHYYATRPLHDVKEFTDDAHWARSPTTTLYYIDGDGGNLCSIESDGRNRQVIVADSVKDYQFNLQNGWVLYRDGEGNLRLWRTAEKRSLLCWDTKQRYTMREVACSPDGKTVAYFRLAGDEKSCTLELRHVGADSVASIGTWASEYGSTPEIAWSVSPDLLFVRNNKELLAYKIGDDLSAIETPLESVDKTTAEVYGRFNEGRWWGNDDWGVSYFRDESHGKEAVTYYGLISQLVIREGDGRFFIADNPGLLHVAGRPFGNVCFLGDGNELVFDDYRDIYLLNLARRKVGWVARGWKFIIQSPRYGRNFFRDESK
jgi:hypothetical protein